MINIKILVKTNKQYLIDLIVFLVVLAGFFSTLFFLMGQISTYNKVQNAIASTTLTYQLNDATIKEFNAKGISPDIFTDALPTQQTLVNWIVQTELMAKNAGVSQTLNFTAANLTKTNIIVPQVTSGQPPLITVDILVSGTYNQILSYIGLLGSSYYYTRINSISFASIQTKSTGITPTPTPGATKAGPVNATITLDLFVKTVEGQPLTH